MATVLELQAFRARLQESRYSGIREVRDANGETVSYKSDGEMARAIAAIDSEIARAAGTKSGGLAYPQTSKGL